MPPSVALSTVATTLVPGIQVKPEEGDNRSDRRRVPTCPIVTGGTVNCRSWNWHAQLGDGTTNRYTPVTVAGLTVPLP